MYQVMSNFLVFSYLILPVQLRLLFNPHFAEEISSTCVNLGAVTT